MVNRLLSLPLRDFDARLALSRRVFDPSGSICGSMCDSPGSSVKPLPRRDLRIRESEWRPMEPKKEEDALYLARGVHCSVAGEPSSGRPGKPACLECVDPRVPRSWLALDLDCDFRLPKKLIDLGALNAGPSWADLRSFGSERKNRRDVDVASGRDFNEPIAKNRADSSWLFLAA